MRPPLSTTFARLSALALGCGLATSCQVVLGIEPWGAGGAGSTVGSTSTSDSTTTGGIVCPTSCFGGACDAKGCLPREAQIDPVQLGFITALDTEVVVAVVAPDAPIKSWKLLRLEKEGAHPSTTLGTETSVGALTSDGVETVYYQSGNTIFSQASTGRTPVPAQAGTTAQKMAVLQVDGKAPTLCWTRSGVLAEGGGIYCAGTDPMNADHIGQSTFSGGIAGDGKRVFTITNVGQDNAQLFAADPNVGEPIMMTPLAIDVAVDETQVYWIASNSTLHSGQNLMVKPEPLEAAPLPALPIELEVRGDYVYVMSATRISRYQRDTLAADPNFAIDATTSQALLDFAVDDDGVYWLAAGEPGTVGFLRIASK